MAIGIRIENLRKIYSTPPPSAARGGAFSFSWQRPARTEKEEEVRTGGPGRHLLRDPPRRSLRPAGAEWRRKIDHHRNPDHPHQAHIWPRLHRRIRRLAGAGESQAPHRRGAAAAQSGFRSHGARGAAVPRRVFRPELRERERRTNELLETFKLTTAPTTWCAPFRAA